MDVEMQYPIGVQSFSEIREEGLLYVDKTDLVYRLVKGTKYNFLSRPRRFGKSLLVSTLEAYFQGRRELFAGLAIAELEREWTQYPVLHVDFSGVNYSRKGKLEAILRDVLSSWEQAYCGEESNDIFEIRFKRVIMRAHAQTGHPVVVLVDEYDKPMLDAVDDEELLARNQQELRGFYGVLKGVGDHLRFVFLTGITRFAHLNIFSGLNNLNDISLDAPYAALCGITGEELQANLGGGVRRLAAGEKLTEGEAYGKLKAMYDGYRFSPYADEQLYNPFSLLMALSKGRIDHYWYASGTPTLLFRLIVKRRVSVADLRRCRMGLDGLDACDLGSIGLVALLYQTGYLTIASYSAAAGSCELAFPNGEVRAAFYKGLSPYLFRVEEFRGLSIQGMRDRMVAGDVEELMGSLHAFIAGFSYNLQGDRESHFQDILVTIFYGMGLETYKELGVSAGRIDAAVLTPALVYIFEFKLDRPAAEAMAQIEEKGYAAPFAMDRRAVVKLGVGFSSKTRNIAECIVREEGKADVRMGVVDGRLQAVGE